MSTQGKRKRDSSDAAYSAVLAHCTYAGISSSEPIETKIKALIGGLQTLAEEYGVDWPASDLPEA